MRQITNAFFFCFSRGVPFDVVDPERLIHTQLEALHRVKDIAAASQTDIFITTIAPNSNPIIAPVVAPEDEQTVAYFTRVQRVLEIE